MRRDCIKVYDDYLYAATGASTTKYSSIAHMEALAECDPMVLQIVMEVGALGVGVTGTIEAHIEHSGDGMNFVQKNATSEIPSFTVNASTIAAPSGGESLPNHANHEYVRIAITLTATTAPACGMIKVYAMGRSRTSRVLPERKSGDEQLPEAVRRHLAPQHAAVIEAFRRTHGMSKEALGELGRLWADGGLGHDDAARASHAAAVLSLRTRREVLRFSRGLTHLPSATRMALHHALRAGALDELARPEPIEACTKESRFRCRPE
jgi:hypothetical protein